MQLLQSVVQSLQWTYSFFWQLCPEQGVLVWADGYYNGNVRIRKMVQPSELSGEEAFLIQRSQQLRQLYESLSVAETKVPSVHQPSIELSPGDLTETEWFYLVCMSFAFPPGCG
ncbi:hypothetical protein Taro_056461, partial [Colocasia esculenta]|nr:hypothetical protein [Colocasia esculenta]